ncbi:transglycosylase SLT domain-containing protein [Rossellomorea marisflavi]|uniref:transglycosylase SLT domain-containing protein n=1 Tax=Rossellomorea marisflavi TaxID=189381 RepID=UPI003F9F8436
MRHTTNAPFKGYQSQRDFEKSERRKKRTRRDIKIVIVLVTLLAVLIAVTHKSMAHGLDKKPADKTEVSHKIKKETVSKKALTSKDRAEKKNVEKKKVSNVYNADIPMPREHQEYLYELCQKQGLDYRKTLAVIQHESVFNPNEINETNDYGYFQVNLVNHKTLAKELGTENSPLNPYVNMVWGTHMLAELYADYEAQGYHGQGLDDAVWSSYNKGKTGFQKYGHATAYIHKMKASIQNINAMF